MTPASQIDPLLAPLSAAQNLLERFDLVKIIAADRSGKPGPLAIGCSAMVFDAGRRSVLLVRRADNGRWCVPGGYMEPGESLTETCVREVQEETGLVVRVVRLVGVYTNPHLLLEYPDGNCLQLVVFHFEAAVVEGALATSDETTAAAYFTYAETEKLDMSGLDRQRVLDGFAGHVEAIVRDDFDWAL